MKVREEDLQERFIRSAGPGGQNVNKVATCVWLRHLPTGLTVKVQRERTQARNRLLARRLLAEKLEALEWRQTQIKRAAIHRIRLEKRRRSAAARERLLAAKRLRSVKKRLRAKVHDDE